MTVYAEQILFDNFMVDGVMLYAVVRILGVASNGRRIALSAGLGSIAALLGAIFGGWVLMLLRVVTSPLMVWIAGKRFRIRKYATSLALFLMLTACFGGACYFVLTTFGLAAMARLPVGWIALGVTVVCVIAGRFLARVRGAKMQERYIYRIVIEFGGKTAETNAYFDSGNLLHDPASGFPVIVFDASVLTSIFGQEIEADAAFGRTPKGVEGRTIPYATAAGNGNLFIFVPEKIRIYSDNSSNILYNVAAGVALIHPIADCKALFGPGVLSEAKI